MFKQAATLLLVLTLTAGCGGVPAAPTANPVPAQTNQVQSDAMLMTVEYANGQITQLQPADQPVNK